MPIKKNALHYLLSVVCVAAVGSACSSEVPDKTPAAAPAAGKKVDSATAGSIAGAVKFDGAVPPADVIRMTTDKNCVQNAGPNPQSDALLVADDKGVRNTFVYVKEGLDPSYTFETPTSPAVLDQKGCVYTPRVLGVRVGQAIEVVNSDPTMHNVHALPMVNREFNHGQPKQNTRLTEVFTAPEVMVRFKCDVHSWMAAWVGVVAHPFFAVTDASGSFKLSGLPPGDYTLEAWHETLGKQTTKVTVAPSQAQSTSITFSAAKSQ